MAVYNSWTNLESKCPISIARIKRYYNEFDSTIPSKITLDNLNSAKEKLMEARGCLDSMIITLVQILYEKEILKDPTDKILYAFLVDNFGRFIKKMDEDEQFYVIKFDEPDQSKSLVGISRLSAYAKMLRTTADSLIYESLLKSTKEYDNFKETETLKKEPRTFLYILFQVLSITLAVMGGLAREDQKGFRKGMATTMPLSWQSLMTPGGQDLIKEGYEEQTGRKIDAETMKQLKDLEEEASSLEEEPEEEEEEHAK